MRRLNVDVAFEKFVPRSRGFAEVSSYEIDLAVVLEIETLQFLRAKFAVWLQLPGSAGWRTNAINKI